MPVNDHSSTYFRWREAKERQLADAASEYQVRDIYLSLAEWYRCLAENAEALEGKPNERAGHVHGEPTPWK